MYVIFSSIHSPHSPPSSPALHPFALHPVAARTRALTSSAPSTPLPCTLHAPCMSPSPFPKPTPLTPPTTSAPSPPRLSPGRNPHSHTLTPTFLTITTEPSSFYIFFIVILAFPCLLAEVLASKRTVNYGLCSMGAGVEVGCLFAHFGFLLRFSLEIFNYMLRRCFVELMIK
ncbi:hypothetical protein BGZ60DRAFT_556015 [Tricladium varicosporioides]|nr:hypothetical protein BGZ60DRAFT_556015 [Hymenoscyphus varicosporioides]